MRGLYAIVDVDFLRSAQVPWLDFAGEVLEARPVVLQLRAKSAGARETLERLRALKPLCARAKVPLFANDRPDLAVLAGCDGVHVGQEDLPVSEVRRFARSLRIGVSTHDLGQLETALSDKPDYVAYGPVFPTSSKKRPSPVVGLDGLRAAAERASLRAIPLVAIGGIELSRAAEVARITPLGAVISALLPDAGIRSVRGRAEELGRTLAAITRS
jgi:thiamine-phosphate pyrophosphorylase